MKIIHVTTSPISLPFLEGQIGYLRRQEVEVLASASPGPELEAFGRKLTIPTRAVPMARRIAPVADLVSLWRLWVLFRNELPDVVHSHTPKAGLLASCAAWLACVPVRIFHIHGLPYSAGGGLASFLLRCATRLSCIASTNVWSVSPSIREVAITDSLCGPEKIDVLAGGSIDGVDAESRFRPKDGERSGVFTVLFAGRLANDKGIRELAETWDRIRVRFPEARLIVAGEPDERDRAERKVLDRFRADGRVSMRGWVQDMPSLYGEADVLVLPTYREGLGMVLIEASAMGLPVVATDIPGCRDAVVQGVTGTLVPVGDSEATAAAVIRYGEDADLRRKHGTAGRERVIAEFAPERIWKLTAEKYRQFVEEHQLVRSSASIFKRLVDLGLASVALLMTAPLLVACAIAVRLWLGSPILFRQTRPGLLGVPFEMFKFRTMTDERDSDGNLLGDGQRLNWFGALLRRTSLDELPELWNVIRGEMSLVGPRPLLMKYTAYFTDRERERFFARPGITGWAQIHGRNYSPWNERLENDVWYVRNWSFALDFKILVQTLWQVFAQKDIAVDANTVLRDLNDERAEVERCGS